MQLKHSWLFFGALLPLFAQYSTDPRRPLTMASSANGEILWFTSHVRPTGAGLVQGESLWRWDGERVELESVPDQSPGARTIRAVSTGPRPGQLAWQTYGPCVTGGGCGFENLIRAQLRRQGTAVGRRDRFLGVLGFTQDGRYLYNYSQDRSVLPTRRVHRLEDWESGQTWEIPALGFGYEGRHYANDASFLAQRDGRAVLLSPFAEPFDWGPLPETQDNRTRPRAVLDPRARFFAYERAKVEQRGELRVRERNGTEFTVHAQAQLIDVNGDGEVLYLAANPEGLDEFRAFSYLDRQTRVLFRQEPGPDNALEDALQSHDRSTLFLRTADGRILRQRGLEQRRLEGFASLLEGTFRSTTPSLSLLTLPSYSPGFTYVFDGRNFPPAPDLELLFGQRSLPILSATSTRIVFQIPPDFAPEPPASNCFGDCLDMLIRDRRLQTELRYQAAGILLSGYRPETIRVAQDPTTLENFYLLHGDWRGPVTSTDPAQPGEILHFYLSGFGPVSPSVPFGQPAPAEPLSWMARNLSCYANAPAGPPTLLPAIFGGLAPGFIGIFQVSLSLARPTLDFNSINCNNEFFIPLPSPRP